MSCIESITHHIGPQVLQTHWHRTNLLIFVHHGNADLQVADKFYHIDRPSLLFIGHLEKHNFIRMDENYARYAVHIAPAAANVQLKDSTRLLSLFMNRSENVSHVLDVSNIAPQLGLLFSLLYEEKRIGDFPDGQTALLQSILQLAYRSAPESFHASQMQPLTNTVRRIQRRFDENPADEASLADLAQEYHLSVSYLTHSFKQATGYSIGHYRLLCRLSAAKQLLIETDLPVSVISSRCGFADLSNFSRYFRRDAGCSPSDFRKKRTFEHKTTDTD